MKKQLYCIPLAVLLMHCVVCVHAEFRAGAAVRVVTPDPLLPVTGGVGPSNPVTRRIGDLTVRAMVLSNDGVTVAIASGDFMGFPSALCSKVRRQVKGIPPEKILIGATHTHSAPDTYGFPDGKGSTGADLKYLDMVCTRMVEAIHEAADRMRPAILRIGTGEARGKIAYNAYAEKLYDSRCHVLQASTPDGQIIATLVNYAIHPEVLGSEQGILSPDLVGPLYERIEQAGGGMGIFMNSAQGGMVTADCRGADGKDERTWEECLRIGRLLADEALRIVRQVPVQNDPRLLCVARTITFPVESPALLQVLKASPLGYPASDATRVSTQMNLINIGDAQILTIPGEALPNIGFYLKRKMRGAHNLLFGLTNDAFGYMLSKVDWNSYPRYSYITRVCLGEMTGEIYIEEALKLVAESPSPEKR